MYMAQLFVKISENVELMNPSLSLICLESFVWNMLYDAYACIPLEKICIRGDALFPGYCKHKDFLKGIV